MIDEHNTYRELLAILEPICAQKQVPPIEILQIAIHEGVDLLDAMSEEEKATLCQALKSLRPNAEGNSLSH